MPAFHPQKKRWLRDFHKSNSMGDYYSRQSEISCRLLGDGIELVLGHGRVRFIFDSGDQAIPFLRSDNPEKFYYRAGFTIVLLRRRFYRLGCN